MDGKTAATSTAVKEKMMMKNIAIIAIIFLVFSIGFAYAHGEEDFAKAEEIIKQKVPCNELTDEDLEIIGEYYMEQMHPGELHEIMDERMGGEGSESLKRVHINMGKAFYCGEHDYMSSGMMSMMMSRGMMGGFGNIMGNSYYVNGSTGFRVFSWVISILIIAILVLIILLLIKQIQTRKK